MMILCIDCWCPFCRPEEERWPTKQVAAWTGPVQTTSEVCFSRCFLRLCSNCPTQQESCWTLLAFWCFATGHTKSRPWRQCDWITAAWWCVLCWVKSNLHHDMQKADAMAWQQWVSWEFGTNLCQKTHGRISVFKGSPKPNIQSERKLWAWFLW